MEATKVLHKKKLLAPKLRFMGFTDTWVEKRLGEIFKINAGGDIDETHVSPIQTEKHKYPIYANAEKNKGFYAYSDIYKVEAGTITIAGRGVNIGIAHARDHRFYPIVRLLVLTPLNNENINFGEYAINRINLFPESTGVPQLTVPQVSGYRIAIPNLLEQLKIASFLSAVDEKIQQLTGKKELLDQYKKGLMQQLFSGKMRFKDENGKAFPKWEEKRLGDVLDYIQPTKYLVASTEYDDSYATPVLTAGKTFILGYTNETNDIYSKNLPVILFDDFTTATQFVDFPFKAKSSAMKILVAKKVENISYIYEAMRLIKFEIGGHGRHWISQFALFNIPYPCIDEQKKIANFLSNIDEKIEIVNKQITQTQTFKKGLLQQMFV